MRQRLTKKIRRQIRKKRIRAKIKGTSERPRIAVFCSNRHIYVQAIDDTRGVTLASASSLQEKKLSNKEKVLKVAEILAEKLKKLDIQQAVFDRAGFSYQGRVKLLAETLRNLGIKI